MAAVRTIVLDKPFLEVGCTLGEGPLYEPRTSTLYFIDIEENRVYHLDTRTLELGHDQFDEPITCLALRRDGPGLACATARGFALIEGSRLKYLNTPLPESEAPYVRFNDGACDVKGRFFAGTVHSDHPAIPGRLWMFDPADGSCKVVDEGPFTDSNGIGWSSDGKTMYFTDSIKNHIHAYDYDDGKISNRRIFIDSAALGVPGFPDGLCIDSEGCIFSCRWDGSRVVRFTTDGRVDLEILLPKVFKVTACCFGGPNEDQLYITTAHCKANGGEASLQAKYPDSGHLFKVDLSGQYRGGVWRHEFGG